MEGTQRIRRSAEERVAEIDQKIDSLRNTIATLETKRKDILNPKPRRTKAAAMKAVMEQAKAAGLSPKEIAEKLGLTIEE